MNAAFLLVIEESGMGEHEFIDLSLRDVGVGGGLSDELLSPMMPLEDEGMAE